MAAKVKLKPCPFCGNSSTVFEEVLNNPTDWSKVECPECEARIYGDNLLIARRKWNRRQDDTKEAPRSPAVGTSSLVSNNGERTRLPCRSAALPASNNKAQRETITPLEKCWSKDNGYCNGMFCKPNECDMRQA